MRIKKVRSKRHSGRPVGSLRITRLQRANFGGTANRETELSLREKNVWRHSHVSNGATISLFWNALYG